VVVLVVTTVVVWVAVAANTRHRAAAAADLAALAAAAYAVSGERSACDRARWVADHMHVLLKACRLDGWDALVEVTAMPPGVLASFGPADARARAGPLEQGR
jgi:secretion/DNA translocation related TadE-like protein